MANNKLNKLYTIATLSALTIAMAGCSSDSEEKQSTKVISSPTPSATETTVEPSPEATLSAEPALDLSEYGIEDTNPEMGIAATGPEFTDDYYGTYNRMEIQEGSPLLEPSTELYAPVANVWPEESIIEGEELTKNFIISYMLDGQSTYVSSRDNINAYLKESSQFIAPEWQEAWLTEGTEKTDAELEANGIGGGKADPSVPLYVYWEDATFPQYTPGQPRQVIKSLTLTEAEVNPEDSNAIIYNYELLTQRPAEITDLDGENTIIGYIELTWKIRLSVTPRVGGHLIDGWYGDSMARAYNAKGEQLPLYSNQ